MPLDTEIIIVSGLPRSGTSLMMQMLDRAGCVALTDQIRTADTDNPRGYFEFERVKKTEGRSVVASFGARQSREAGLVVVVRPAE